MNLSTSVRNGFAVVTVATAMVVLAFAAGCGQSTPKERGQEKPLLAGKPVELPADVPEKPSAETIAGKTAQMPPSPLPLPATAKAPDWSVKPASHQADTAVAPPPLSSAGSSGSVRSGPASSGANPPLLANPLRSESGGGDDARPAVPSESPAPLTSDADANPQPSRAAEATRASATDAASKPVVEPAPKVASGTAESPKAGSELIIRVPAQQPKSDGESRPATAGNKPPAASVRPRPSNRSTVAVRPGQGERADF